MFVDHVTAKAEKAKLKDLVQQAKQLGLEDLVNAVCFRDKEEGRTPLAYAVAKNFERVANDLIDLGAQVDAEMGNETALTLAVTNKIRDGTSMVRLLLSRGASPSFIRRHADANVEAQLNHTMKYWLERAEAAPHPSVQVLHHLAKCPPMHRLHEINYALIGQDVAIQMVKQALSNRF